MQLYITIYNEKCFLRNLNQDRSWHTKSQIAHFLQKKQFWAPLSHAFAESMTATQFKLIHLLPSAMPLVNRWQPPNLSSYIFLGLNHPPWGHPAPLMPLITGTPVENHALRQTHLPPPWSKQPGSNGWINARIANRHANRAKNGKNRHLAKKHYINVKLTKIICPLLQGQPYSTYHSHALYCAVWNWGPEEEKTKWKNNNNNLVGKLFLAVGTSKKTKNIIFSSIVFRIFLGSEQIFQIIFGHFFLFSFFCMWN